MSYTIKFSTKAGGCCKQINFKNQTKDEIKEILSDDMKEDPYINFWYGQDIKITNKTNSKKILIKNFIKMNLKINNNIVSSIDEVSSLDKKCSCDDECEKCIDDVLYHQDRWIENVLFECQHDNTVSKDKTEVKVKFKGDLLENNKVTLYYNTDYSFFDQI